MALAPYQPLIPRRTAPVRLAGGWQTGDPNAIARRYAGNSVQNAANAITFLPNQGNVPPPRLPSSAPAPTGAAGPAGDEGASGDTSSAVDTAPMAQMPPAGVQPPQGNATQRWAAAKDDTGMKELSPQRRYFWATGSIDGRAPKANPGNNKGAPAPVTFKNSPSNWTAY